VAEQTTEGPTDTELLTRFAVARDQGAFELLVWRHAGLVMTVCRSIVRDHHTAEDLTQAAFLMLARKAASVRDNPAGWLYRVAYRLALRHRPARFLPLPGSDIATTVESNDHTALHEELARLGEKYRVPILLCFFEGLSQAEAAQRLGWPVGTVAGRIARAKETLLRRLSRRGIAVPAAGITALCSVDGISNSFAAGTTQAATAFAAGTAVTTVSAHVLTSARGALRAMTLSKLQLAAGIVLAVSMITMGGLWAAGSGQQTAGAPSATAGMGAATATEPDWWLITLDRVPSKDRPGNAASQLLQCYRSEAVQISTGRTLTFSSLQQRNDFSPDGRWAVSLSAEGKVMLERVAGDDPNAPRQRVLAEPGAEEQFFGSPVWSADGKSVIAAVGPKPGSAAGPAGYALMIIPLDGSKSKRWDAGKAVPQLLKPVPRSHRVAYLSLTEQRGKERIYSLMIHDGTEAKPFIDRTPIFDYAFSPDGMHVAIGNDRLIVYLLQSKHIMHRITMSDVNPKWYTVFSDLVWRPDGKAIAFKPLFVGGFATGFAIGPGQKFEEIRVPGDDAVGTITFTGDDAEIRTYTVARNYRPGAWSNGIRESEATKPQPVVVDPKAPNPGKPADPKRDADFAQRQKSQEKLKRIANAMINYHDAIGSLPQDSYDLRSGKALLSWRVHLLPYLDQFSLYKQFNLDEPWDSETNRKLLAKLPDIYRTGIEAKDATDTYYQGFAGPETIFEPRRKLTIFQVHDGLSNTLAVAEVGPPVPWSKPADVPYAPDKPFPKVEWPFANVIQFVAADGAYHSLKPDTGELILRRLIERNDGQVMGDLAAMRPVFPADTNVEKLILDLQSKQTLMLLNQIERLQADSIALMRLKINLTNDLEKTKDIQQQLNDLIRALEARNKKDRDDLGLKPGAKIPDVKEVPKP
jgi:RNA polymerase sigma factor (sigma-70 family)